MSAEVRIKDSGHKKNPALFDAVAPNYGMNRNKNSDTPAAQGQK
jgi:hypothetical protein